MLKTIFPLLIDEEGFIILISSLPALNNEFNQYSLIFSEKLLLMLHSLSTEWLIKVMIKQSLQIELR